MPAQNASSPVPTQHIIEIRGRYLSDAGDFHDRLVMCFEPGQFGASGTGKRQDQWESLCCVLNRLLEELCAAAWQIDPGNERGLVAKWRCSRAGADTYAAAGTKLGVDYGFLCIPFTVASWLHLDGAVRTVIGTALAAVAIVEVDQGCSFSFTRWQPRRDKNQRTNSRE